MPVTILPESTCDICVYEYGQDDTTLCVLPCGHPICQRCMHSLQGFPRACPFCRQNVGWQEVRPLVCDIAPAAPQASLLFDTNNDNASFVTALADDDEIAYFEPEPAQTEKQRADQKAAKLLRKLTDAFFLEAEAGRDGHPDSLGQKRLEKVRRFMDDREDGATDYGTLHTSARMFQAFLDQRVSHAEERAQREEWWNKEYEGMRQIWIEYAKSLFDDKTKLQDENQILQRQLNERQTYSPLQPIASSSRALSPSISSAQLRRFHQIPSNNDHNPMPAPPKLVRTLTPRRPAQFEQQARHSSMSAVSTPRRVSFAETPRRVPSTPLTGYPVKPAFDEIARLPLPAPPARSYAPAPAPAPLPPPSSPPRPPPRTHRALPSELPDLPEPEPTLPPFEVQFMYDPPEAGIVSTSAAGGQRHPDEPGYAWAVGRGDDVLIVPGDRTPPEVEEHPRAAEYVRRAHVSDGYSDSRSRRRFRSPIRFRYDAGTGEFTQLYPLPAPAPTTSVSSTSVPSASTSSMPASSSSSAQPPPPPLQYGSASTSVQYAPPPGLHMHFDADTHAHPEVPQPPPPRRDSLPSATEHYRRRGRGQATLGYPQEQRATLGLWAPLDSDSDAPRF